MSNGLPSAFPLLDSIIKTTTIKTDNKFLKDILQIETKLTYNDKRQLRLNINNEKVKDEKISYSNDTISSLKKKPILRKQHIKAIVQVENKAKQKFKEKDNLNGNNQLTCNCNNSTKDESISKASHIKRSLIKRKTKKS